MAKYNKIDEILWIEDNRWSFIALLKVEIDGCNLNESSKSFQIFTDLQAKDGPPEAVL